MLVLEATVIPAAPQTFVVEVYTDEDGRLKTFRHPVVAWDVKPHHTKATPILLTDIYNLSDGASYAVMFENGEVYDSSPEFGGMFDTFDDWLRVVEPEFTQRPHGENPAKKREPESRTIPESKTPSKARATSSPILMTPEQERETEKALADLEAQARETMARLHKDGVIQGAPQGEPEKPKRRPRRTKHVPADVEDLI
jgi:hypothetical protein